MSTSPISSGASTPVATAPPTSTSSSARKGLAACRCEANTGISFGVLARRATRGTPAAPDGSSPASAPCCPSGAPGKAEGPLDRSPDDRVAAPGSAANPELVDPLAVALAMPSAGRGQGAPAADVAPAAPDAVALATRVSLEQLLSRLVRRIAWSGDAHTGCARIELGAGTLEGATLVVRADHGDLSVSIDLPPGVDRAEWRDRIASRLGARGLKVASLDVE